MSERFSPTCFKCGRMPEEIPAMVRHAQVEQQDDPSYTADDMAREDGTYNYETNHFACDECYIAIGMPANQFSSGLGPWKAP